MTYLIAILSVMGAHLLTNVDNAAVLLASGTVAGRRVALLAFVGVQFAVLFGAGLIGDALATAADSALRWLGLVPIALGLRAVIARRANTSLSTGSGLLANAAIFASLSTDSLAILLVLFADSTEIFDTAILLGSAASILAIAGLVSLLDQRLGSLASRLEPLAPFAMIAAGIYVLLDTRTDIG